MTQDTSALGGRLPLLRPEDLSADQKKLYEFMDTQFVPGLDAAHIESKTDDGRMIGPFNPLLYSPAISSAFLAWQVAEAKYTALDARVRQVVILTVGTVWKTDYELYFHHAVALGTGLSERTITQISAGQLSEELSDAERIAQRYAMQLVTAHRIDDDLFAAAKKAFGLKGLVDMVNLIGAYDTVCGLLNSFAIPAPEALAGASRPK